jgi:hypothetical protein
MKKFPRIILLAPLVLALLVCSCRTIDHDEKKDSVKMVAPKIEKPEFIFHRVMAGETLATIAKWYTGMENMWHEIAEDNPGLSPFSLRQGDIVNVSISMATVHKEQPAYSTKPSSEAVQKEQPPYTKPGKATKKYNQGPAVESDPSAAPAPGEVFGPR